MIRNVFIPPILIVLTSAGTVYCWYEDLPLSLVGLVGFMTLFLGSMYISYYIFYRIFPDKRNIPVPHLVDLMAQAQAYKKKGNRPVTTKGSIWAAVFTVILSVSGILTWFKLTEKYADYQLTRFGRHAKAWIISSGHTKGIGTYREYEYMDDKGEKYTDKVHNETLWLGDTIDIIYSTARPIINKITTELP